MNKYFLIGLLPLLLLSCNRRSSELEIIDSGSDAVTVVDEKVVHIVDEETKPLIYITRNDVLEIYVRADGAPGMFLNDYGELEGFYVDLEKEIMKEMDQKYNLNSYTDLGPLIQNIKSGEGHSVLATVDVPDYRAMANISTTYEVLPYVIFWPKDSEMVIPDNKEEAIKSMYGKKVGVQTRAHIYQILRDYKDIEIVEYPTTTVAMEALHNGEVDAVPEVRRIGVYYSKLNDWNVKPVGSAIFELNIGTGFSKVLDTSVVDRYNVALQSLINSGYVDNLYESYFGE